MKATTGVLVEDRQIVCQAWLRGDHVAFPLHAVTRAMLAGSGVVRCGFGNVAVAQLVVECELPDLDLLVCAVHPSAARFEPCLVAARVDVGSAVAIELFVWSPEGPTPIRVRTTVHELLEVGTYTYRAGDGAAMVIKHACLVMLDMSLPTGASGALVRRADDDAPVGTIHGNLPRGLRRSLVLAGTRP